MVPTRAVQFSIMADENFHHDLILQMVTTDDEIQMERVTPTDETRMPLFTCQVKVPSTLISLKYRYICSNSTPEMREDPRYCRFNDYSDTWYQFDGLLHLSTSVYKSIWTRIKATVLKPSPEDIDTLRKVTRGTLASIRKSFFKQLDPDMCISQLISLRRCMQTWQIQLDQKEKDDIFLEGCNNEKLKHISLLKDYINISTSAERNTRLSIAILLLLLDNGTFDEDQTTVILQSLEMQSSQGDIIRGLQGRFDIHERLVRFLQRTLTKWPRRLGWLRCIPLLHHTQHLSADPSLDIESVEWWGTAFLTDEFKAPFYDLTQEQVTSCLNIMKPLFAIDKLAARTLLSLLDVTQMKQFLDDFPIDTILAKVYNYRPSNSSEKNQLVECIYCTSMKRLSRMEASMEACLTTASIICEKLLNDREETSLTIPVQIHLAELAIALNQKATRPLATPTQNVVVNGVMTHMRTKVMPQLQGSDIRQCWKDWFAMYESTQFSSACDQWQNEVSEQMAVMLDKANPLTVMQVYLDTLIEARVLVPVLTAYTKKEVVKNISDQRLRRVIKQLRETYSKMYPGDFTLLDADTETLVLDEHTIRIATNLESAPVDLMEAFINIKGTVDWLCKRFQGPNKLWYSLPSTEGHMEDAPHLLTRVAGFFPLIHDIPKDAGMLELLERVNAVWKMYGEDTSIPEMLTQMELDLEELKRSKFNLPNPRNDVARSVRSKCICRLEKLNYVVASGSSFKSAMIVQNLHLKIPQVSFTPREDADILRETRFHTDVYDILTHLDASLSILNLKGGPPDKKLLDFMDEQEILVNLPNMLGSICHLKHIRSLWMLLSNEWEKYVAQNGKKSELIAEIQKQFLKPLTEDQKECLEEGRLVKNNLDPLLLNVYIWIVLNAAGDDNDGTDPDMPLATSIPELELDSETEPIHQSQCVDTWQFIYHYSRSMD